MPPSSLVFFGQSAAAPSAFTIAADAGAYEITGTAASLQFNRVIVSAAGSYAITGTDTSTEFGREIAPDAGSYAITGTAATLSFHRDVAAVSGSYAITGTAASLEVGRQLAAVAGAYAITGSDATLTHATPNVVLNAESGSYAITGTAAELSVSLDGVASGQTVTATASLGTGEASGDAATVGVVLDAAASLFSGQASGDAVNGEASGAVIEVTSAIIAGVATVSTFVEVGYSVRIHRDRFKDGRARGALLVARARILPGTASGTALHIVGLVAGKAFGNAVTPGSLIETTTARVISGEAKGVDAVRDDNEFLLLAA